MTKIYLPTELGVVGEGSPAGINDKHTPEVHEVKAGEEPAVKEQPDFYKNIYDVEKEGKGTIAEQNTGEDNTRNQAGWDESPKEGGADEARKPVKLSDASLSKSPNAQKPDSDDQRLNKTDKTVPTVKGDNK